MEPEKKINGALIGAIIIILILVLGGVYVWMSQSNTPAAPETVTPNDTAELDALEQDVNSAEVDLEANVVDSVE